MNKKTKKKWQMARKNQIKKGKTISVLLVVFFVAMILQFEWVQRILSQLFPNLNMAEFRFYASVAAWSAFGLAVIMAAALIPPAIPFVGAAFAIAGGLVLIGQALRVWNWNSKEGQVSGLGQFEIGD